MRCIAAALLVLLVACGGDDNEPADEGRDFLEQFEDIPAGPDFEGHPTRVDEDGRTLYIGNCDAAKRATADGGPYGPSAGENGYAYICP